MMDFDQLDRDDYLGTCTFDLSKLKVKEADAEGGREDLELNLSDSKTNEPISSTISLSVRILSLAAVESVRVEVVYEYERWTPTGGWGKKFPGNLFSTDPGCWSDGTVLKFAMSMEEVEPEVEEGWAVKDGWAMVCGHEIRADGWMFGNSFSSKGWSKSPGPVHFCRRRSWERKLITKK